MPIRTCVITFSDGSVQRHESRRSATSASTCPLRSSKRPRTNNKYLDHSFCALRPVWRRRYVRNANKSPEQIEWIEVWTYVAAFDRTVHQRMDGRYDQRAGGFKYLTGSSNKRIQCRGDNLLRRDVVNEEQHPGPQRFARGHS